MLKTNASLIKSESLRVSGINVVDLLVVLTAVFNIDFEGIDILVDMLVEKVNSLQVARSRAAGHERTGN